MFSLLGKGCTNFHERSFPMRKILAVVVAGVLAASLPAAALGNAKPPTNGGNGAGHSGQCTGNPNDRPASCGP
jgi:hypothetical protein